ncbi:hypothetical protein GCM10011611_60850 [Aliidongia dinghuensis]|uniref:Uncharacterized protein n=1 Tax=Aliidongia dinghuensis TaxID=1867774 RepID=A0A8J2Z0D8_9PROT|nr:hypothetical protein [Aliidongia dinghuensis]GGF46209.1 hypothetical protein GCM10011611_60850 [Aliidongia dinghuensis]
MSDRIAVYKTPLQRLAEIFTVLLITIGSAALSHAVLPDFSVAPVIILSLIAGFVIVSWIGSYLAERLGGTMMTASERSRRYLDEITPAAGLFRGFAPTPVRRNRGGRTLG